MTTPITVISTEIFTDPPQSDGRYYVREKHTFSDGNFTEITYLADANLDINAVASERASNINAEFAARQAIKDKANNFSPPISVAEFIDVIPREISVGMMELRKTSALMDLAITRLTMGAWVEKATLQSWLDDLVNAQVMAQATSDAIIAAWTAKYG